MTTDTGNAEFANTQSPFDRLANRFDSLLQSTENALDPDKKAWALDDGTRISIYKSRFLGRSSSVKEYIFECNPPENIKSNQTVFFKVADDGLSELEIPTQEFLIGNTIIYKISGRRITPQNRNSNAIIMVDWAEKIIKDARYSPPPLTATMLTDFPTGK